MLAFRKMLTMVKGGLLSRLVRCLLRRRRSHDEDDQSSVEGHRAARAMSEEEGTVDSINSNVRIASDNQIQSAVTVEAEHEVQALSGESPAAHSPVTQPLERSPNLLPNNIVCILPDSDLGIQFAEAIRALSPLKTETEIASSTQASTIHADNMRNGSIPPSPPPLPETSRCRPLQFSLAKPAVTSKASTRSKRRQPIFRFLDLPAEIRWMVYQLHFESQDLQVTRSQQVAPLTAASSSDRTRKCVVKISASTMQLRYVCRQIYDESTAAMLNFSNFDLMTCTEGPHKVTAWTMPAELLGMIRKFSCNNVYFVRQLWQIKRTREKRELLDKGDSTLEVFQGLNRPKSEISYQIGSLTHQEHQMNQLREIDLYTTNDLLRGLTVPRWMTENWFSNEDAKIRRILDILEVRQLMDDFEKHATYGCKLRLKSVKQEFKYREIELRANGSIIVRGVPSAWQDLAERRIQQWLQLSRGKIITFEDSKHRCDSKTRTPIVGRS